MPPKKKRIKRVEDSDWQPNVSAKNPKENSNSGICIIHCTDAKDPLTSLSSSATWTKLLEVAKLRNDERVLEIAKSLRSEEFPNIKYHERCKKVYTHSGTLERLSKKRKAVEETLEQAMVEQSEDISSPSSSSSSTTVRTSSRVCSSKTVLPKKCIFCNKDKYKKNTRNREKLSSCMQIRADENIRKIATEKNDSKVLAITTDELISKEAHYHFSCYRSYTRQEKTKKRTKTSNEPKSDESEDDETKENETTQDEPGKAETEQTEAEERNPTDSNIQQVIKYLVTLYEKPDIIPISTLQDMLSTKSEKKNLKRNIEKKSNDFKFVRYGKTFLIYPVTLKIDDMVLKLYEANKRISNIEGMVSTEKIVTQAANIVKNEIKNWKGELSWPPRVEELLEMANFVNPPILDSFLLTLLKEGDTETSRVSRIKSSIGQDLLYAVHKGSKLTPKSVLLPCQIKDICNSYELITTINKLGHGISYTVLQEILTEVAYQKTELADTNDVILPENCSKGRFTILVEDNIDRLEETLSGHGTTHKVNSIVIQPTLAVEDNAININGQFGPQPSAKKKKRRSFKSYQPDLPDYVNTKKIGPEKMPSREESFASDLLFADQSLLYNMWIILRKDENILHIPSWTGFFINLQKNLTVEKSNIGYLDCLDAPATELSTIYYMMERSLRIKDQLQLNSIVCVYDQAIYAKVYQIKCREPEKFKAMFVMMGTFHIILTFLAVIASRFKDAGLRDILIQSNVVAEGSVDTMFSGSRAYKRAIRVYKILYEAMSRILLKEFENENPNQEEAMRFYLKDLPEEFDFNFMAASDELLQYLNALTSFKEELAATSNLAKFWISFLDMVEILFNLIYATRAGNWYLYVESVRSTLPWFFAYDRTNYSRYLTVHHQDLLSLEEDFPEIHTEFERGNFSVQVSKNNPFGRTEADKVIETTINRDTKTPGGTTGFSTNHGAVQRWTYTAAYRASARHSMEHFLSYRTSTKHPDLFPSRIKKDHADVNAVIEVITRMFISPFEEEALISLSSGVLPPENVALDLLDAHAKGEAEMKKFINERLVTQEVGFYDPLKRLKLGTFTKIMKRTVKAKDGKVVQFSAQSEIFGKIAIIQQTREVDLKEIFCYPLGPVPWSLATSAGELVKTNKSALMHELEKGPTCVDFAPVPVATIIDGMAMVRKIKNSGLTYTQFADELLKFAVSSNQYSSRIDIVFDVYRQSSIKNAERDNRDIGKLKFKKVVGCQPIKQWGSFLSSGENKTELIRFLVSRWKDSCDVIGELDVYVAYDDICVKLATNGRSRNVSALASNQEEADTRMLLHAKDIDEENKRNIVIQTPDTDVFMISLSVAENIRGDLFIRTGTQNKARIISITKVKEALSTRFDVEDIGKACRSLLGLHAFTGCDTVSALSGKGKSKPVKLLLKESAYIDLFSSFGSEPSLSESQHQGLQQFVCHLYGHKEENTNIVRYKLYSAKQGRLEAKCLPPCSDSLRLHANRACYQAYIWRKCLESSPDIPSPIGLGWEENDDGDLVIKWNTILPAPEEILQLMYCSCSKKCVPGSCPCVDNSLACTDACANQNCENFPCEEEEDEFDGFLSSDEEDYNEDD